MSDVLSLVSSLQIEVRRLSARVEDFERRGALDLSARVEDFARRGALDLSARVEDFARRGALDLDRVLSLKETAVAIGKSPTTLRRWLGDAQLFDRHQIAALVRKDPTNHWVSSPRLVARWKQVAFRALQELAR